MQLLMNKKLHATPQLLGILGAQDFLILHVKSLLSLVTKGRWLIGLKLVEHQATKYLEQRVLQGVPKAKSSLSQLHCDPWHDTGLMYYLCLFGWCVYKLLFFIFFSPNNSCFGPSSPCMMATPEEVPQWCVQKWWVYFIMSTRLCQSGTQRHW